MLAIGFTLLGVALAAVVIGDRRLAAAEGIVSYSLVFTLWSFLGLLTLPTPSRRGVAEVDQNLLAAGCPPEVMTRTIEMLDDLQDRERQRGSVVEVIFHPVPSVQSRLRGPRATGVKGCWDAARSAMYLSLAGLGLLGRAVHCNCGRPSLWAFSADRRRAPRKQTNRRPALNKPQKPDSSAAITTGLSHRSPPGWPSGSRNWT